MNTRRILHVIPSVNPVYGGTVEALMQLVQASLTSEQQHEILTLDDASLLASYGHDVAIHAVGPTRSFYGYCPALNHWLRQHLSDYDCAVIHGCWQYHGLATFRECRRQGVPYVQYPHGMLDPWFKRQYPIKHLKKWLYWPWAEYRILKHAARVVFTCEQERLQSATSFWLYRVNPAVIPLGIREPAFSAAQCTQAFVEHYPRLEGKRRITFLSRIHEKKGVDLLVEAALQVQRETIEQGWSSSNPEDFLTLVIAGPCENQSWLQDLKMRSQQLQKGGPIQSIEWLPMVRDAVKWGLLQASEAFILPSHQENFGIVVAESLACGTPVLLSDKVNVWEEASTGGAGFVATDDLDGTASLLRQWLALDAEQRQQRRRAARTCFLNAFEIGQNSKRFFELLEQVCQNSQ